MCLLAVNFCRNCTLQICTTRCWWSWWRTGSRGNLRQNKLRFKDSYTKSRTGVWNSECDNKSRGSLFRDKNLPRDERRFSARHFVLPSSFSLIARSSKLRMSRTNLSVSSKCLPQRGHSLPWAWEMLRHTLWARATTSCKYVETLQLKIDLSQFKSLLVTLILSCSSKFWAWPCIASNVDKGRRVSQEQDHGQAI